MEVVVAGSVERGSVGTKRDEIQQVMAIRVEMAVELECKRNRRTKSKSESRVSMH